MNRLALIAAGMALVVSAERVSTQNAAQQGPARQNATRAGATQKVWTEQVTRLPDGEVRVVPVRGNVHMIVGAGANITVHAGNDGVLLVDSGTAPMSQKVLAAVRSISSKPLRYIVNTTEHDDHTGGNDALAAAGSTIRFRIATDPRVSDGLAKDRATVISHLNVLNRMSAPTGQTASRAEDAWPDNTYSTPQKKLYFNDEPVVILHNPSTTDGNSIVHFRGADVISIGSAVDLRRYPFIDRNAGGSIDAMISGLARIIDITVPNRRSEAGTLVIPGYGRIADQPDIVYYHQMLAIVRDRIKDMASRGMTLDQVKAARPTLDYDPRYGGGAGGWTPDKFVEAVYADVKSGS